MRTSLIFRICLLASIFGIILPAYAGQWRDTFDSNHLEGWTPLSSKDAKRNWTSNWEPGEGMLDVTFKLPGPLRVADFLQWIAGPIHGQSLEISVNSLAVLDVHGIPSGQFGIFLGRKLPTGHPFFAWGYYFTTASVKDIQFNRKGEYVQGDRKAIFFPRSKLKVSFNAGRFHLFSEDVLLTDFEDTKLQSINVVGLLALTIGATDGLHCRVREFVISGQGIPNRDLAVRGEGKLAKTWGGLKRF